MLPPPDRTRLLCRVPTRIEQDGETDIRWWWGQIGSCRRYSTIPAIVTPVRHSLPLNWTLCAPAPCTFVRWTCRAARVAMAMMGLTMSQTHELTSELSESHPQIVNISIGLAHEMRTCLGYTFTGNIKSSPVHVACPAFHEQLSGTDASSYIFTRHEKSLHLAS